MDDPTPEIIPALMALLQASAAVQAAFRGKPVAIYDTPPANAPYPFVAFPTADARPVTAECMAGADVTLQIDVWSRPGEGSGDEARRILAAVMTALEDVDLALPTHALIDVLPVSARTYPAGDGLTFHGVGEIQVSADPA